MELSHPPSFVFALCGVCMGGLGLVRYGFSVMLMLNRCVLLYIEQVIIQCLYMHIETIQSLISCQRCSTRSFTIH